MPRAAPLLALALAALACGAAPAAARPPPTVPPKTACPTTYSSPPQQNYAWFFGAGWTSSCKLNSTALPARGATPQSLAAGCCAACAAANRASRGACTEWGVLHDLVPVRGIDGSSWGYETTFKCVMWSCPAPARLVRAAPSTRLFYLALGTPAPAS